MAMASGAKQNELREFLLSYARPEAVPWREDGPVLPMDPLTAEQVTDDRTRVTVGN